MGTFREATALTARGGGEFGTTLDAEWSVGTRLHGGYLLAVLGRAAGESAGGDGHPHVTAVSGTFVEPPEPGDALARVETLRVGRSVAQVRAALVQEGRTRVEAHITLGLLDDADPWWSSQEAVELPREEDCFLVPVEAPGAGFSVPLMAVVEERMDPAKLGFAFGAPSRHGVISSWQRLADGSDWDPLSLLVALDPVPPVSYDLGLPGWVPTIQLSAYIRRLPAPGPVRVRLAATDVGGERMDEVAHVWDDKGRLVGQATQLAAVRVPA
ncbi:thioesterase family protein [Nonomuraea turkmeniaca]|uniref:Thioesterase family protein n=1 Tax=Nonomuraea turkmeniaca TaxID=103838 RepID=A0A5S4G9Z8_9ACTN|nr:thioesterase family protein [Nonomuraea turkmeniaca]TMR22820.1 thioesterase family protein [Nonomuraea turkmeniaca]